MYSHYHYINEFIIIMIKNCTILTAICLIFSNFGFTQQIKLDLTKEYQTIVGFGGFWTKDQATIDADYMNQLMNNMGITIFRSSINWDFEPVNDNNDPSVLDESKLNYGTNSNNGKQFEFYRAVKARGGKIIVSVWSIPTWMKDFSDPTTIPDECWNCWNCPKPWTYPIPERRKMCGGVLKPEYYEEYAEYLVAYVKTVKKQTGVDIYALSLQNEPLFANPFESGVMRPKPYAQILNIVGARFEKEGLSTLFFGPESMGEYSWGTGGNQGYVNEMFNLSTAGKNYLDMFAVHGYLDGVANDFGTATGWTALYNALTVKNGKPLWMTETGNLIANNFDTGFKFAKAMHLALKFGHISGWVFWGLDGNVIVDNRVLTHTGNSMKSYYKHIKPGSISVEATTTDANVLVTAYKKGKSIVVVAINNSTSTKTVDLSTGTSTLPTEFKVYRYSANETGNLINTVTNNSFQLTGNSVTTMVYEDLTLTVDEEANLSQTIIVYPTEILNNEINVEYTGQRNLESISLISLEGKVIKNFNVNPSDKKLLLKTDGIEKGLYLLKISTDHSLKSQKIFIK